MMDDNDHRTHEVFMFVKLRPVTIVIHPYDDEVFERQADIFLGSPTST